MRVALVVDATCDLPPELLRSHGVKVLPIVLQVNGQRLVDTRDVAATQRFYQELLPTVGAADHSEPLPVP